MLMRAWYDTAEAMIKVLADSAGRLRVAVDSIAAGSNLIGRVDARNGDKLASMSGRLFEVVTNLNAVAGQNNLNGAPVPAGEIWHITHGYTVDTNSATTRARLFVNCGGTQVQVYDLVAAIAAGAYAQWDGHVVLAAGDFMFGVLTGCAANDDITFGYLGWKESI